MNLKIDAIKLNDIIEAYEKEIVNLTNAYKEIENELNLIDGTNDIWSGKTQKTAYDYYVSIQKDFEKSIENVTNIKDFLKKTLDNYMESIKPNKKNVDDNEDSIDIE